VLTQVRLLRGPPPEIRPGGPGSPR